MTITDNQTLNNVLADLAWWFRFSIEELDGLTLSELDDWVEQLNRQVKAGYTRGL